MSSSIQRALPGAALALVCATATITAEETAPASDATADLLSYRSEDGTTFRLIDVSLDLMTAVGTSNTEEDHLSRYHLGSHDPRDRGFTFQQAELRISGAVDPYFEAQATMIITPEEGLELEEAFATTTAWPVAVRAGYYLTEFGRFNDRHPHSWWWLDRPLPDGRLLGGEGMRGTGARAAYTLPIEWSNEIILGVQNADDDTMTSFLGGGHDHGHGGDDHAHGLGGRPVVERDVEDLGDLLWSARFEQGWDLDPVSSVVWGLSGAWGPNASGPDGETLLYGTDVVYKYREGGPGDLELTASFIGRRADMDGIYDDDDPMDIIDLPGGTLNDWGLTLQGVVRASERWHVGLRYELLAGSGASAEESDLIDRNTDWERDDRWSLSPVGVYDFSEFSRLRFQYEYQDVSFGEDHHAVAIGLEVLIGSHPAHDF